MKPAETTTSYTMASSHPSTLVEIASNLRDMRRKGFSQVAIIDQLKEYAGRSFKVVSDYVDLDSLNGEQTASLISRIEETGEQPNDLNSFAKASQAAPKPEKDEFPTLAESMRNKNSYKGKNKKGKNTKKTSARPTPVMLRPKSSSVELKGESALMAYVGGKKSVTLRVAMCKAGMRVKTSRVCNEMTMQSCVVFDALSWEVISVAPRSFANSFPKTHAVTNDYVIARADDGTVCTMYLWYNPVEKEADNKATWCISTARGYDVSGIPCLFSSKSWARTIYEVMCRVKCAQNSANAPTVAEFLGASLKTDYRSNDRLSFSNEINGTEITKNLKPRYCYTIGFRNHDLHPLTNDPESIWSIQSIPLNSLAVAPDGAETTLRPFQATTAANFPGIDAQTTYTCEDLMALLSEAGYEQPADGVLKISDLRKLLSTSMEEAQDAIRKNEVGRNKFNYGYALRSSNVDATMELSDIIIDSPLLEEIRRHMYNQKPKYEDLEELEKSPARRHTYNAIKAILMPPEIREKFMSLFSIYKDLAVKCDNFLSDVIKYAITRAKEDQIGESSAASIERGPVQVVGDAIIAAARREANGLFDPHKSSAEAVLKGHLRSPNNAMVVMRALGL